jgi:outer membrane receptor protein involved in Fe transport
MFVGHKKGGVLISGWILHLPGLGKALQRRSARRYVRLVSIGRLSLWIVICVLPCFVVEGVAQTDAVSGVVKDSSGAVVVGASIHAQNRAWESSAKSDASGHFSFANAPAGSGRLDVTAQGFVKVHRSWNTDGSAPVTMEIVLQPSAGTEQVMVSATRAGVRLAETPGSGVLLTSVDVTATPALRIDDALRQVPGFSLFRRSGSRTANASAQGVSLRGLGGSASSRALVLTDGIPLADPFGAWVYWDRVPRAAISSVEVVRGGASNLYGSSALGGVVQVITKQPEAPAFALDGSLGNELTPELSAWTGSRVGRWDYSLATEMFRTDGFILVPGSARGSVDTPANSEDATVYARVGHELGASGRVFLRGNFYTESRNNGTRLQVNDTRIGEGAAGLDKPFGANDSLSVRLYGDVTAYNQTFSSVAPNRSSETLTDLQHVPEQVAGGGAQWTHELGKSQTLIGGGDLNEVIGASNEHLLTGTNKLRDGGGRQRTLGFFGEDIFHRAKWTVIGAARVDDWKNFRGILTTVPVTGPAVVTVYPDRTDVALSPRLSVLRAINDHVSATGSVYRAFRAPTLNELYRTFRVGNVLTLNNAGLSAERLTGAEAGVNVKGWGGRLSTRGTFFWSDIVDPVANVTLTTTPTLITRKKENLGRTRSRGVELDGTMRVSGDVQISAGYAYTAATVVSFPGNPGGVNLVGLDVAQVPRNVFTWEARYWNPSRILVSLTGRFVGRQFDDDQNQLLLNRFYTMDAQVGRAVTRNVEIYGAVENLTNQRYQVAKTPVVNLGPPILFRVGVRLNYPAARP